jgi:hypothetical protein
MKIKIAENTYIFQILLKGYFITRRKKAKTILIKNGEISKFPPKVICKSMAELME